VKETAMMLLTLKMIVDVDLIVMMIKDVAQSILVTSTLVLIWEQQIIVPIVVMFVMEKTSSVALMTILLIL
jgi:hypothetical protein